MFHGVSCPGKAIKGLGESERSAKKSEEKKVFSSIMEGLEKGEMLRAGRRQLHKKDQAINQPGTVVGEGIYGSPHLEVCLGFAEDDPVEVEGKKYRLVLQCRVRPEAIKVCQQKQTYWVINESKDIRPYGVVLVEEENV